MKQNGKTTLTNFITIGEHFERMLPRAVAQVFFRQRTGVRYATNEIFNRDLKKMHRERSLRLKEGDYYDYLRVESAANIVDRIEDITRSFPRTLEIGSYRGEILKLVGSRENYRSGGGGVGGIQELVQCDLANSTVSLDNQTPLESSLVTATNITIDEENGLPFDDHSFDLVVSSLGLHWNNDIPGTLLKIKNVLKPDGAFIGSMLGGDTLKELRYCFYLAEQERRGGISPHASPMVKRSDVAALMQGAGFSLPTIDVDTITVDHHSSEP
jgi:NADH dehydrogenase [ubiquinone] 1 alpha subcomplex assembly factor 5